MVTTIEDIPNSDYAIIKRVNGNITDSIRVPKIVARMLTVAHLEALNTQNLSSAGKGRIEISQVSVLESPDIGYNYTYKDSSDAKQKILNGDIVGTFGAEIEYGTASNTTCQGNDSRLSDARTPLAHTHTKSDISSTGTWATTEIPNLDTSKLTTGTMATARLGSGTADSTTFLRGDQTWASPGASSTNIKETEIDFGTSSYQREKTFTITDADVSTSSQLIAFKSFKTPSDGRQSDEVMVEPINISTKAGTGNFDLNISVQEGTINGKFIINYLVG